MHTMHRHTNFGIYIVLILDFRWNYDMIHLVLFRWMFALFIKQAKEALAHNVRTYIGCNWNNGNKWMKFQAIQTTSSRESEKKMQPLAHLKLWTETTTTKTTKNASKHDVHVLNHESREMDGRTNEWKKQHSIGAVQLIQNSLAQVGIFRSSTATAIAAAPTPVAPPFAAIEEMEIFKKCSRRTSLISSR